MPEDTEKLGVNIDGVTVKKLTAFNAAFIRDNKIGPGTIIKVTRQGDAIPYIKEIIKSTTASLPDKTIFGDYTWNTTKVDLILKSSDNDKQKIQQLIRFFEATKIEYFSEGTIRQLYSQGIKEVPSILKMDKEDWSKIPGFKDKSITRVIKELSKLQNPGLDLPTYMYASGAFGRGLGKDKLQKIYEEFGDDCLYGWNDQSIRDVAASIETIHGFSFETGVQFAKGIEPFLKFAKATKGLISIVESKKATGNKLKGVIALMTGFRDQFIQDHIIDQGGKVAQSFNSSVNLLLIKNKSTNNDKTEKAAKLKVTVLTQEEYKKKYMGE